MKVAFINQPIDAILPPKQSSIGICTYGVARQLARSCQVIVYGNREHDAHRKVGSNFYDDVGVHYRFLSAAPDKVVVRLFNLYSRLLKLFASSHSQLTTAKPPISASRWFYPGYALKVAMDLRQQRCDIVHIQHSSQFAPIIRLLNPKVKIVLHLHAEWFPQCNFIILEQRLSYCDLVTSVSDFITNKNRKIFPQFADLFRTIYNGIDPLEFVNENNHNKAKKSDVKKVLYVGAISPHKGVHILLEAFKIVAKRYSQVQLEVVGPYNAYPIEEIIASDNKSMVDHLTPFYLGKRAANSTNYRVYLEKMLSSDIASKVSFTGQISRSELVNRFLNADIFVFPPIWDEGFGIPPVEAMIAGIPVVATRSGAIVETVQDGKTGLLVDKGNALALAEALLQFLENDDLRESMGRAGQQRALDFFTWERIAEKMLQQYQNLYEPASKSSKP